MERRINKVAIEYVTRFKNDIRNKINEIGNTDTHNELIHFVSNYEQLSLGNELFTKRRRVKNIVPQHDRCTAKRANGEQCTRRKKEENVSYCGTHIKGTPHGIIDSVVENNNVQKIELWAQDIQGIVYYIDKNNNIYKMEDIISNKSSPQIIGKYEKFDNTYKVVEYFGA